MRHTLTRWLAAFLFLAVAGCADAADEDLALDDPSLETPAATEPAPPALDVPEVATLDVDSLASVGSYLTDASGRALYLLEGEPEGESTCYDACAEEWPPLLAAQGMPAAGAVAVQPGLIATLQRRDGSSQVTYGGHALYYYHDDQGPGQTTGQDVTDQWGEWYLVRPTGEALESGESAGGSE